MVARRVRPSVVAVIAEHGLSSDQGVCAVRYVAFDLACGCGAEHEAEVGGVERAVPAPARRGAGLVYLLA